MNGKSKLTRLFREHDTEEQREQIAELVNRGYHVERKSPYHVKILDVNYYFPKGTITIDPATRHKDRGLDALLTLLKKKHPRPAQRYSSSKSETLDQSGPETIELILTED